MSKAQYSILAELGILVCIILSGLVSLIRQDNAPAPVLSDLKDE